MWGGICDDEWDRDEAKVACQMLGFPGAIAAMHGSRFKAFRNDFCRHIFARYGYTPTTIWMDNLYCYGTEDRLDVRPPSQFRMHSTQIVTLINLIYGTAGMQI